MTEHVLDASAMLALLRREKGYEKVQAVARLSKASAVNLAEVGSHLMNAGATLVNTAAQLDSLGVEVIPFDEKHAIEVARLRPLTRSLGLSLSDRACLALARQLRLPAMTTDRAWTRLQIGVQVIAIR
jgi:PIN domain nuclease of toxin-antitoxin system